MVQPTFEIGTAVATDLPADSQLLVEISHQSLNYVLYTRENRQLYLLRQYRMYTSADRSVSDLLEEIIASDTIITHHADKAKIIYNFPAADLVPADYYTSDLKQSIAKVTDGDATGDLLFDEQVNGWNMYNIYRVSRDIHLLCKDKFKGSQYWHLYTMILLNAREDTPANGYVCRLIFYNDKFIVACFRDRQLLLLQTFFYQTPEDVAYYLLLICKQLDIPKEEIILTVSGLIDAQSALFTELLKYFVEVQYDELPEQFETNELLKEYPQHYFSPLLKMSLCV